MGLKKKWYISYLENTYRLSFFKHIKQNFTKINPQERQRILGSFNLFLNNVLLSFYISEDPSVAISPIKPPSVSGRAKPKPKKMTRLVGVFILYQPYSLLVETIVDLVIE